MSREQPEEQLPEEGLSVQMVVVFYGVLVLVSFGLALLFDDLDLLVWHRELTAPLWMDAAVGLVFGLIVVVVSQILDHTTEWAERLGREFGKLLGPLSVGAIFIIACASGFAEELFFRGFLQQVLSDYVVGEWWGLAIASLIFGSLHIGPDARTFLPWTAMAIVFGAAFGWMYMYSGNLLGPVVAHFTINFFNLLAITRKYGVPRDAHG